MTISEPDSTAATAAIAALNTLLTAYAAQPGPAAKDIYARDNMVAPIWAARPLALSLGETQALREERQANREAAREATEEKRKFAQEDKAAKQAETASENTGRARQDFHDELRAKEMRAAGDHKGADALERQNTIRTRAVQIERDLGLGRMESAALAARETDALLAIQDQRGGVMGRLGGAIGRGGAFTAAGMMINEIGQRSDILRNESATTRERVTAANRSGRHLDYERVGAFGAAAHSAQERGFTDEIESLKESNNGLDDALEKSAQDRKLRLAAWAAKGAGIGAGIGFLAGGVGAAPGAAIGAVLGAGSAALYNKFGGFDEEDDQKKARKGINDAEIKDRESRRKAARVDRIREVGDEVTLAEKRAAGDRRAALVIARQREYEEERKRVLALTTDEAHPKGDDALAERSAAAATAISDRSANMKFGGLLNARSGAGDIARVGALVNGDVHSYRGGGTKEAVDALTQTVVSQHLDIKTHMPPPGHMERRDLRGRPL